jgi:hypothetical protein
MMFVPWKKTGLMTCGSKLRKRKKKTNTTYDPTWQLKLGTTIYTPPRRMVLSENGVLHSIHWFLIMVHSQLEMQWFFCKSATKSLGLQLLLELLLLRLLLCCCHAASTWSTCWHMLPSIKHG